jgi:Leucine-rich repeat (LRR) protein
VLAVLLAVLLLANVPGQIVVAPRILDDWQYGLDFSVGDELQHGWPVAYLWRRPNIALNPADDIAIAWRSLWTLTNDVNRWSWAGLTIDLLVMLVLLALGGVGYEAWRRRRAKLWQFHLSDLLVSIAIASVALGYWKLHADDYRSQQEALAALNVAIYDSDWQPGGPSWLRILLKHRRFQILDRVVGITLDTDAPEEFQHLARLRHLKRIVWRSGKNLQYLVQVPGLQKLRTLDLQSYEITDDALVHLAGLNGLETLLLDETQATDAGLVHLQGLTHLRNLRLPDGITAAGLSHLARLTNLERLDFALGGAKFDGAMLKQCRRFTKLRQLRLGGYDLTDEQLTVLAGMTQLETLEIDAERITERGLAALRPLVNLRELKLAGPNISDAELRRLTVLPRLETLELVNTSVTDRGLNALRQLANLEVFYVENAPLTDASLSVLARLPQLTTLILVDTEVTDVGLLRLAECQQFQFLDARGPHITREGRQKLLERLPNCNQQGGGFF